MDKEKMHEMHEYFEAMQYLGELLDYIDKMDIIIDDVSITGCTASIILGSGEFEYKLDISEAFNLYTVIRALYKQYDEGTEAENDILKAAVADVLFRFIVD